MSRAEQIEQRAALWLLASEEKSWSGTDQAELDRWLDESDAHKVAYWRLEAGWRGADRIASLGGPAPRSVAHRWRTAWWQPLALAASLLIVFAVTLTQWPIGSSQAPSVEAATGLGGHKLVSLRDGSQVELNTNTAIKAVLDRDSRRVWLDRGEAFFDVAKQPGQEFVIYAGDRTITVLGTKFSVRRENGQVVVAVLEGRVQVAEQRSSGAAQETTIGAGDVAIASDRSTLVTKTAGAVERQLAWRSGLLVFNGDSLASAAEQFNRYNRKRLIVGDAEAARTPVTGRFRLRDVDGFARLAERAFGLDLKLRPDAVVLASRKLMPLEALRQPSPPVVPQRIIEVRSADAQECGPNGPGCAVIPLLPAPAPPPPVARSEAKAARDAQNWSVLHNLYPPRALAAKEEGMVGFTVSLDARGDPTRCQITHTSGHPLLDLETCQLIMMHATFKRPENLNSAQQKSYEGVVNWKLPNSALASVPAPPRPVAESVASDAMICRRFPRTGSNVATDRICMPKSEWDREAGNVREKWLKSGHQ